MNGTWMLKKTKLVEVAAWIMNTNFGIALNTNYYSMDPGEVYHDLEYYEPRSIMALNTSYGGSLYHDFEY